MVLYYYCVVDHEHYSDEDRYEAGKVLHIVDISLSDPFALLKFKGVLDVHFDLRVEFEQGHNLLSMGLSLHICHYLVSQLLGKGVEDWMLREIDDLVVLILSSDLDLEDSLFQVLNNLIEILFLWLLKRLGKLHFLLQVRLWDKSHAFIVWLRVLRNLRIITLYRLCSPPFLCDIFYAFHLGLLLFLRFRPGRALLFEIILVLVIARDQLSIRNLFLHLFEYADDVEYVLDVFLKYKIFRLFQLCLECMKVSKTSAS